MRHIIQNQKEMDHCIICGDPISVGTDPATCSERCNSIYEYEVEYNKACREEAENSYKEKEDDSKS